MLRTHLLQLASAFSILILCVCFGCNSSDKSNSGVNKSTEVDSGKSKVESKDDSKSDDNGVKKDDANVDENKEDQSRGGGDIPLVPPNPDSKPTGLPPAPSE